MLWSVILLTFYGAIFDEATGTILQFYVINFRFAARCTCVHFFTFCFCAHDNNFAAPPEERCFFLHHRFFTDKASPMLIEISLLCRNERFGRPAVELKRWLVWGKARRRLLAQNLDLRKELVL
jgi:hypothetical protein